METLDQTKRIKETINKMYLEGTVPYAKEVIEEYTSKGWWENHTVSDFLDRMSTLYPDKTAIIDNKNHVSYAELKEKVDRFATALIQVGNALNVNSVFPSTNLATIAFPSNLGSFPR